MTGEMSFKCLVFFDSIAKSHIKNPNKSLLWGVFAEIVTEF